MKISDFVGIYNIEPGDAITVKKNHIGLLNHYIIYLGKNSWNHHVFMANYTEGTRILSQQELMEFGGYMHPVKISKFKGSNHQREMAINRALELKDQNSYNLILNNCEHYKNYVQTGKPYSEQTNIFGASLTAAGVLTAATSKSEEGKAVGLFMAGLGLFTLFMENKNK